MERTRVRILVLPVPQVTPAVHLSTVRRVRQPQIPAVRLKVERMSAVTRVVLVLLDIPAVQYFTANVAHQPPMLAVKLKVERTLVRIRVQPVLRDTPAVHHFTDKHVRSHPEQTLAVRPSNAEARTTAPTRARAHVILRQTHTTTRSVPLSQALVTPTTPSRTKVFQVVILPMLVDIKSLVQQGLVVPVAAKA